MMIKVVAAIFTVLFVWILQLCKTLEKLETVVSLLKAGINPNVDFPTLNMGLIEISRLRFKQDKNSMLIPLLFWGVL